MDCVFCSIIQSNNSFVYQNDHYVVINDKYPAAPVHYLIIPRKHIINLKYASLDEIDYGSGIFKIAKELNSLIGDQYDFKLMINNGAAAGQVIFHMHTHFMAYPSKEIQ